MLLFHGTACERELIEAIFRDGLRPHGGRDWAHTATGVEAHVFVCTSPVGSKGGDPIAFAWRHAGRHERDAWIVVVDLPATAEHLVVGAIPNDELERYWTTRSFTGIVQRHLAGAREIIAVASARRCASRELLAYRVISTADGLVTGEPDAETLIQFERAYLRARSRAEKARVGASYGLNIPREFAEDPHHAWCAGCMHHLFVVDLVAPDVDPRLRLSRGAFDRIDRETMGAMLDALGRWLAACDPARLARALRGRELGWAELQREFPPPRDQVPRTFWPDFATADLATRMREPDTQLLLTAVPAEHIAGAIHIGDGDRLSARVRPSGGQTLAANLWHLAQEAREARSRRGKPVFIE